MDRILMLMRMLVKDRLRMLASPDERCSCRRGAGRERSLRFRGEDTFDTGLASLCVLLRYLYPGKDHWRIDLSFWFRPLRASHLIRCAHPSGQPAAVTALRFGALPCPRESNQKEGHPDIQVTLRSTPLAPAPLRGPAYMGHPWPIKPFAASMRLIPLRDTSTRPPDGTGARACVIST